jgi:hypothetical protein
MKTYTPWFGGDKKPVRKGTYEILINKYVITTRYWTGKFWALYRPWVVEGLQMTNRPSTQNYVWRGLTKEEYERRLRKRQHGYSYGNGEYWCMKVAKGYQGKEWKGLTEEGYEHQKNAN